MNGAVCFLHDKIVVMLKSRNKNIIRNSKYIVASILLFVILIFSFSCVPENRFNIDDESESIFVPEAANQFALDKETEVETVEETKAHHIYKEEFKLAKDLEIVIGEKQFLTKINYIFNHADDFKNSDIIVEGMYGIYTSWDGSFVFPMVYRNGPGCCGDDQYGGFYLINMDMEAYNIDDWMQVKGKPFIYEHTDSEGEVQKYLFLLVESIEVKSTRDRKAEMVNN